MYHFEEIDFNILDLDVLLNNTLSNSNNIQTNKLES